MSTEELPIGWIIRTNKLTSNKVSETLKSVLHFSKFNFTLNNKVEICFTQYFSKLNCKALFDTSGMYALD